MSFLRTFWVFKNIRDWIPRELMHRLRNCKLPIRHTRSRWSRSAPSVLGEKVAYQVHVNWLKVLLKCKVMCEILPNFACVPISAFSWCTNIPLVYPSLGLTVKLSRMRQKSFFNPTNECVRTVLLNPEPFNQTNADQKKEGWLFMGQPTPAICTPKCVAKELSVRFNPDTYRPCDCCGRNEQYFRVNTIKV